MNKNDLRKKLVQNLPYLLIGLYATKLSQAWRLAAGNDASEKLLHYSAGLSEAFQSPLPSFDAHDLLFGAAVSLLLALVVGLPLNGFIVWSLQRNIYSESVYTAMRFGE